MEFDGFGISTSKPIWNLVEGRTAMSIGSCNRCHRRLSEPESVMRGYGPVCWGRTMCGSEDGVLQTGTNIVLVADDPRFPEDVFFQTLLDGNIETNVRQQQAGHSPTGYGWGYGGSGPADLALNILLRFVSPQDAWIYHQDFKWQFIATAPEQGTIIKGETIRRWIDDQVQTEKAKTA